MLYLGEKKRDLLALCTVLNLLRVALLFAVESAIFLPTSTKNVLNSSAIIWRSVTVSLAEVSILVGSELLQRLLLTGSLTISVKSKT